MRQRSPNPLPALAVLAVAAIVGGCTSSVSSSALPASAAPPARTAAPNPDSPEPTARFNASPDVPMAGDRSGILLVGQTGATELRLVVAQTGESVMTVPDGAMDPGWQRVVTAKADAVGTIVRDIITEDSSAGTVLDVKGRWRLPTIGVDSTPAGISADGSTFALVSADPPAGGAASTTSRFAIVQHVDGVQPTRLRTMPLKLTTVIELKGGFDFDAISPDGSILYVVEHLDGEAGAYQVRAVDVATGTLRDGVIVDKRNIGEAMAGWPLGQVRRADGIVLTIYRGTAHPFIHALNTIDAWAVCIDLPSSGASDAAAAGDWGLAADANGRSVYAVNATLGIATEIDPTDLVVKRTGSLKTASGGASGPAFVLAKFGHDEVGAAGRVVVSTDGATVWAAGADGIAAIATRDLSLTRRLLAGTAIDAIAVAPDRSVLYALARGGGGILAVDPDTGRQLGAVPGKGFDRLIAAAPW